MLVSQHLTPTFLNPTPQPGGHHGQRHGSSSHGPRRRFRGGLGAHPPGSHGAHDRGVDRGSSNPHRPGGAPAHPGYTSQGHAGLGSGHRYGSSGPHRGGYGGHRSGGRRQQRGQYIDPSRFVKRAIVTEEASVFVPEHQFADFALDARLKANLARKGYVTPTPIQDKAIPHGLRGEDVVGIANTGTGKTAAFLLPLLHRHIHSGLRTLVMAPTRELAVQIDDELRTFAHGMGVHGAIVVGGAGIGPQISAIRRNPAFVVGTPGRLKDLIQQRVLDLSRFGALVLDEADRMLDMGFMPDVRFIVGKMPTAERQTLLFSATMPPEIERLIGDFLRSPVKISVKTGETAQNVDQDVIRVPRGADKPQVLAEILRRPGFSKVLVFSRTKWGTQKLAQALAKMGIRADAIHGNKSHAQRLRALAGFKEGKVQALCATDVAARGLDVSNISHVINYDQPGTYEDYVHRIGRTGRAGKMGVAITFVEG